jgi:hypothetical protein
MMIRVSAREKHEAGRAMESKKGDCVQAQQYIWGLTAVVSIISAAGTAAAQTTPETEPAETQESIPTPAESPAGLGVDDLPFRFPFTPYTKRTAGMPAGLLIPNLKTSITSQPDTDAALEMDLGAALGLTDRLSADATLVPLVLTPRFRYGNPRFGVTYKLATSKPFDVAATVHITFNTSRGSAIRPLEPGVLMILRFDPNLRVDTGAYVPITIGRKSAMDVRIPASVAVQLTSRIHAGVNTGITVKDITRPERTGAIPLGFSGGYSTAVSRGVVVDVLPFISWPNFIASGGKQTVHPNHFVVGVVTNLTVPR